jgi:hypothetical protein
MTRGDLSIGLSDRIARLAVTQARLAVNYSPPNGHPDYYHQIVVLDFDLITPPNIWRIGLIDTVIVSNTQ